MFYTIAYNLPIWNYLENKDRNVRIFILGTILFVLLHSFLYSTYISNPVVMEKRFLIYFLIPFDMLIVAILIFFFSKENISKKKKNHKKKKNLKILNKNSFKINPLIKTNYPPKTNTIKLQKKDTMSESIPIYKGDLVNEKNKIDSNDSEKIPMYIPSLPNDD